MFSDTISQQATKRAFEKAEAVRQTEYEIGYEGDIEWLQEDASHRREVNEAKVRAERLEITNDEVNRWIQNLLAVNTLVDEPDFTGYHEWAKRMDAEPTFDPDLMPERFIPEMVEEMPLMSENEPPAMAFDMRANLSLPYGDESLNRSVFELNISDESDTDENVGAWL